MTIVNSANARSSFGSRLFPKLLPETALVKTGSCDDKPGLNFHPILGAVARLRFWIILSLMSNRRFSRLLEIGYGSGIFLPELARHCDDLYGLDIHGYGARVQSHLRHYRVAAELQCGNAAALPYADETFDCIVAVSCLEYMDPCESVAKEIKRVLRRDGCFVLVTPGNSRVIDFAHDLLTGGSCSRAYGNRRDSLIPILMKSFVVQQELTIPRVGGDFIALYRGLRLGVS